LFFQTLSFAHLIFSEELKKNSGVLFCFF
jgi:hypothetical protein